MNCYSLGSCCLENKLGRYPSANSKSSETPRWHKYHTRHTKRATRRFARTSLSNPPSPAQLAWAIGRCLTMTFLVPPTSQPKFCDRISHSYPISQKHILPRSVLAYRSLRHSTWLFGGAAERGVQYQPIKTDGLSPMHSNAVQSNLGCGIRGANAKDLQLHDGTLP